MSNIDDAVAAIRELAREDPSVLAQVDRTAAITRDAFIANGIPITRDTLRAGILCGSTVANTPEAWSYLVAGLSELVTNLEDD
jgi:hypothetical protein